MPNERQRTSGTLNVKAYARPANKMVSKKHQVPRRRVVMNPHKLKQNKNKKGSRRVVHWGLIKYCRSVSGREKRTSSRCQALYCRARVRRGQNIQCRSRCYPRWWSFNSQLRSGHSSNATKLKHRRRQLSLGTHTAST
jgi:hypothetical protein